MTDFIKELEQITDKDYILDIACRSIDKANELFDCNLFHNYKFREELAKRELTKHGRDGVELVEGVHGADFHTANTVNGEVKTITVHLDRVTPGLLNREFQFDKQNDEIRRQKTLEYDCFFFGVFHNFAPKSVISIIIDSSSGVEKLRKLLKEKQDEKVKEIEHCKSINKRLPRDTIGITINDIFAKLNDTDFELYFNQKLISVTEFNQRLENNRLPITDRYGK